MRPLGSEKKYDIEAQCRNDRSKARASYKHSCRRRRTGHYISGYFAGADQHIIYKPATGDARNVMQVSTLHAQEADVVYIYKPAAGAEKDIVSKPQHG